MSIFKSYHGLKLDDILKALIEELVKEAEKKGFQIFIGAEVAHGEGMLSNGYFTPQFLLEVMLAAWERIEQDYRVQAVGPLMQEIMRVCGGAAIPIMPGQQFNLSKN